MQSFVFKPRWQNGGCGDGIDESILGGLIPMYARLISPTCCHPLAYRTPCPGAGQTLVSAFRWPVSRRELWLFRLNSPRSTLLHADFSCHQLCVIQPKAVVLHLYNVGPTSKTLGPRYINVIQIFCVFWKKQSVVYAYFSSEQILVFAFPLQFTTIIRSSDCIKADIIFILYTAQSTYKRRFIIT